MKKAIFCGETSVTDPETGSIVDVEIYRHENGGMFAIDSSYIEQVADVDEDDETFCYIGDPFNIGDKLMLVEE